tara:strand:- start:308 stop:1387 length:1080 start_codon:yes stop_codon:yes gene_type:complete
MAIVNLTLTNIFYLVSFLSPLLIVFFMIFSSLLSGFPMKGVMFFTGCILLTMLVILIRNIIKNKQSDKASIICNTLPFPFGQTDGIVFTAPYMNIVLLVFTFFYLVFSMMYNKYSLNILLLIFIGLITLCNIGVEFINNCVDITSIIISILVGALFALIWYTTVSTLNPAYTYFSEFVNNNVVCSKPRPQSYVCRQRSGNPLEDKFTQDQVNQIVNSINSAPNSKINMARFEFDMKYSTTQEGRIETTPRDDHIRIVNDIDNRLKTVLSRKLTLAEENIIIVSKLVTSGNANNRKFVKFHYKLVIAGSPIELSNDSKLELSRNLSTPQKFSTYFDFPNLKPNINTEEEITVDSVSPSTT